MKFDKEVIYNAFFRNYDGILCDTKRKYEFVVQLSKMFGYKQLCKDYWDKYKENTVLVISKILPLQLRFCSLSFAESQNYRIRNIEDWQMEEL